MVFVLEAEEEEKGMHLSSLAGEPKGFGWSDGRRVQQGRV